MTDHNTTKNNISDGHYKILKEYEQMESIQREIDEKYSFIFESAYDGIVIADMETKKLVYANPSISNLLGYTRGELTGMNVGNIHLKEDLEKLDTAFESLIKGHKVFLEDIPLVKKNGVVIYAKISLSEILLVGKPYTIGFFRDLSSQKQVEEYLKWSEEKFRGLFMQSFDGIALCDDQGRVIEWNQAMERITGIHRKDAVGVNSYDLSYQLLPSESQTPEKYEHLKGSQHDVFFNKIEKALNKIKRYKIQRPDGTCREAEYYLFAIRTQRGIYIGSIIRDVTERQQMEEALLASGERFQAIAESTPDAVVLTDHEGKVIFWNEGARKVFGYSKNEILGRSAEILIPERQRYNNAQGLKRILEQGSYPNTGRTIEVGSIKMDGTEFPAEYSTSVWKRGGKIFLSSIIRDITERKQTEEAIRKSEERFRQLAERANAMIYRLSLTDGIYEYVSPGSIQVTGYTPEEWYNTPNLIQKVIHPEWLESFERQAEAIKNGEPQPFYELKIIHKSGEEKWIDSNFVVLYGDKNQPTAVEAIILDITERKRAEEELKKHHDHLDELVKKRAYELSEAYQQLRKEIEEKNHTEQILKEREAELEIKSHNLEESNVALKVLLNKSNQDRDELEEGVLLNVKELITPYIKKLKTAELDSIQLNYVNILESNLNEIVSPITLKLSSRFIGLTPKELKVANLVKQGKSTKGIATTLSLSKRTIDAYRDSIRKKLGLKNRKARLRTHLQFLQ